MARVKLVPTERLDPALRDLTEQAVRHRENPAISRPWATCRGRLIAALDLENPQSPEA